MTRKQALCGIVSRYPEIEFDKITLRQYTKLKGRKYLLWNGYVLSCGFAQGYGSTIQKAFDSLIKELK